MDDGRWTVQGPSASPSPSTARSSRGGSTEGQDLGAVEPALQGAPRTGRCPARGFARSGGILGRPASPPPGRHARDLWARGSPIWARPSRMLVLLQDAGLLLRAHALCQPSRLRMCTARGSCKGCDDLVLIGGRRLRRATSGSVVSGVSRFGVRHCRLQLLFAAPQSARAHAR
jgi:hypothetical protein